MPSISQIKVKDKARSKNFGRQNCALQFLRKCKMSESPNLLLSLIAICFRHQKPKKGEHKPISLPSYGMLHGVTCNQKWTKLVFHGRFIITTLGNPDVPFHF